LGEESSSTGKRSEFCFQVIVAQYSSDKTHRRQAISDSMLEGHLAIRAPAPFFKNRVVYGFGVASGF
jgi:hypothetical protein